MTDGSTGDVGRFEKGKEYDIDGLPDSDMTANGKLEMVGDGTLGARYGDTYVTFEFSKVRCLDVRSVDTDTDR